MSLVPRPGGQVGVRITHSDRLDWSAGLKSTSLKPNKSLAISCGSFREYEHLGPAERGDGSCDNVFKGSVTTLVAATVDKYCVTHSLDGRHARCLAILNPGDR